MVTDKIMDYVDCLKENKSFTTKLNDLMKCCVFIVIVCFLSLLLGDFLYIVVFDITFMILKIHYEDHCFKNILKYYSLFLILLTLFPKMLLVLSMDKRLTIVLTIISGIVLIKERYVSIYKIHDEMIESMEKRKNIIVFMIWIIILVMGISYFKVAQMMMFALIAGCVDLLCIKNR